jgi:hypothetical protein
LQHRSTFTAKASRDRIDWFFGEPTTDNILAYKNPHAETPLPKSTQPLKTSVFEQHFKNDRGHRNIILDYAWIRRGGDLLADPTIRP